MLTFYHLSDADEETPHQQITSSSTRSTSRDLNHKDQLKANKERKKLFLIEASCQLSFFKTQNAKSSIRMGLPLVVLSWGGSFWSLCLKWIPWSTWWEDVAAGWYNQTSFNVYCWWFTFLRIQQWVSNKTGLIYAPESSKKSFQLFFLFTDWLMLWTSCWTDHLQCDKLSSEGFNWLEMANLCQIFTSVGA